MATPSLFPQFLKAQAGGPSGPVTQILLDEIAFELPEELAAQVETPETEATLEVGETTAELETTDLQGQVETGDITATVEDEYAGEIDCDGS